MISPTTAEIVKSTAPVLEQRGSEITTRFYQLMFANHPELLNLFNHANQKQGRQPFALAQAVTAAAKHIDRLEEILPAVVQIGHKHRSLGVKPEQYPIVGRHLLMAIKDVLGDQATDEVLQAWEAAYQVIADVFIQVEAEMYARAEGQPGGWADFRPFRVERKVRESAEIQSFYLVPADGGALAGFLPGQYVSVKAEIPGENYTHIRQYSLSDAPDKPYYRITVKREAGVNGRPDGKVSLYLHDRVREGDTLLLSAPAGSFVLDTGDPRPLVLIAGGVGVTPLMSMLKYAAGHAPERPVKFIHASRNGDVHALKSEAEELARSRAGIDVYWCYEQPTERDVRRGGYHKEGYIDRSWLQEIVGTKDAAFYFCGPVPFMKAINEALHDWGVAEADIRYEFFGPAGRLDD